MVNGIKLDGGMLEGGGQILRTASALSCILQKPFEITNIRANRPKPGLQAQHLAGISALAVISGAKTTGLALHSTSLSFSPGKIMGGAYTFEVGTAGACTLVAQSLLPALLFANTPSKITITGGTHVPFSPTFDYFNNILLPAIAKMGAKASAKLEKHGWYPAGGGQIELNVAPARNLAPIITPSVHGKPVSISGISICSKLPLSVAERQASSARKLFKDAKISTNSTNALSPGSAITLWANFAQDGVVLGSSALGKPGKPAEAVGEEVALALQRELASGAAADAHLADQLMVFAALADGTSTIHTSQITQHARTNAWLLEQFTGKKVMIDEEKRTIGIEGMAVRAQ
jgi:RNA 3'-terminal phosphate cyclase (ATP)